MTGRINAIETHIALGHITHEDAHVLHTIFGMGRVNGKVPSVLKKLSLFPESGRLGEHEFPGEIRIPWVGRNREGNKYSLVHLKKLDKTLTEEKVTHALIAGESLGIVDFVDPRGSMGWHDPGDDFLHYHQRANSVYTYFKLNNYFSTYPKKSSMWEDQIREYVKKHPR